MKKKSLLSLSMAIALVAIMAIGGTIAWLTHTSNEVKNVFTFGKVSVKMTQESPAFKENLLPGQKFTINPVITNNGTTDARLMVELTINKGSELWKVIGENKDMVPSLLPGFNGKDFVYRTHKIVNGELKVYFESNKAVAKDSYLNFCNEFKLPTSLTNAQVESMKGLTVTFKTYAVQAEGFNSETWGQAFPEIFKK